MALKAILDSLDGLPEAVAKEYKEVTDTNGKRFVLDAEGVEDVTGLKSALSKERTSRTALEKIAKKLGVPIQKQEDVDALLEKMGDRSLEEVLTLAEGKQVQASEALTAAEKKAQRIIAAKDEEIIKLSNGLSKRIKDDAAKDAIVKAKGNDTLLMPHVIKFLKVVEEDGAEGKEYVAQVLDKKGQPRMDSKGEPFTVSALVAELKGQAEFAGAFEGSGASGSGAGAGGSRGSGEGGSRTEPVRTAPSQNVGYGSI